MYYKNEVYYLHNLQKHVAVPAGAKSNCTLIQSVYSLCILWWEGVEWWHVEMVG